MARFGPAALAAAIALLLLGTSVVGSAQSWTPPSPNAKFDYQIGGDYPLPGGVEVVSRDWFLGAPDAAGYSICYVNAFQTQDDEEGVDRPDERSNWPAGLVLRRLGDDPKWGGEYLIDLRSAAKRAQAADWVQQMIQGCADKGSTPWSTTTSTRGHASTAPRSRTTSHSARGRRSATRSC